MSKLLVFLSIFLTLSCGLLVYHSAKTQRRLDDISASSKRELEQLQTQLRDALTADRACDKSGERRSAANEEPGNAERQVEVTNPRSTEASAGPFADADRRFSLTRNKLKILRMYGPLLRKLDLSPLDRDAMIDLLAIAFQSPDADERRESEAKITAKLDRKGQQIYREYERTLPARQSLDRIDYDLQSLGIPLTEDQKYFLIASIVTTREAFPAPDTRPNSMEDFERFIAYMDEMDRRVLDQSRTVLSGEQVGFLEEYYEAESASRHRSLQATRQERAQGNPNAQLRWHPPGGL